MKLYVHYLFGINAKSGGITDKRHMLDYLRQLARMITVSIIESLVFERNLAKFSYFVLPHNLGLQHKESLVFSHLLLHFVFTFTVKVTTLSCNYLFEYLSSLFSL